MPLRSRRPNQSMKPTAPLRNNFSVFATTPCRGLSLSRRSMKRWVISGAIILLVGYSIAYRFLPWRDAARFRNAELFVHTREFRYEWEGRLFYPAAYMEWRMIRAHPQPWLPHPSWSTYPQVLLLEAGDRRWTFPLDAFRRKPNQSMKPTSVNEDTRQAASLQEDFSVFATTPWISSRHPPSLVRFVASRSRAPAVLFFSDCRGLSLSR